ncbi:MAG: hypothetical protein ABSA23_15585 [Anaerolineales bacterium]|jgi:hypothetical protein
MNDGKSFEDYMRSKVFENYVRRKALRLGLKLRKSRAKKKSSHNFGLYQLDDASTGEIIHGIDFMDSLKEVDDYLGKVQLELERPAWEKAFGRPIITPAEWADRLRKVS